MRSRPYLSRFVIAVLGVPIFVLACVAVLGWMLRTDQMWPIGVLGAERYARWKNGYARVLARAFQKDTDGDGFSDALESFLRDNANNPKGHPHLELFLENPGFTVRPGHLPHSIANPPDMSTSQIQLQPGERRRIRAWVRAYRQPAVFVPGMQLRLISMAPLALPGGTASATPLLVPVASDGALEFDLVLPSGVNLSDLLDYRVVKAMHPLSNQDAGFITYGIVRKLPPFPCETVEVPRSAPSWTENPPRSRNERMVRLSWRPPVDKTGMLIIEATRDGSEKEWFPIGICEPHDIASFFRYAPDDSQSRYRGPMKFRVVPTMPSTTP